MEQTTINERIFIGIEIGMNIKNKVTKELTFIIYDYIV